MDEDSSSKQSERSRPKRNTDVVLMHSRTKDGEGIRALRSRSSRLEMAEIRPLKQGKPIIGGEVVRLHPREESPLLCDVEVQYRAEDHDASAHAGPAQVASDKYRRNWDVIFGDPRTRASSKRTLN